MAETVQGFKFPSRYPWDQWANGEQWKLKQGEDFHAAVGCFEEELMEFTGGFIFCPVCVTKIDLVSEDQTEWSCYQCDQQWTLVLDPARLARYSIA